MLAHLLENFLSSVSANTATEVLLWCVIAVFAVSLHQAQKKRHSQFLEHAPALMTSLGILGTFIGIVIALLHFDTTNFDSGIPKLLDGVKVAFVTSVAGLFFSILFNAMDGWWFASKREAVVGAQEATPEMIYATLQDQKVLLGDLAKGLSGAEEGSIVGQLKLLRGDVGDFSRDSRAYNTEFSRKLWVELQSFSEMMSRSATGQIIEALNQVIRDFNEKLTEQFGENFKALDASVKKLVEWQAEYREQVAQMGQQYQQSVESLVTTRAAVAGIWEECKAIPLAMAELRTVIETNQHQIAELDRHLAAFVAMRDAAVQAVPTIHHQIEYIGQTLQGAATGLQSSLEQTSQQMLVNSNVMKLTLEEGAEQFRNSVTTTQQAFGSMASEVSAVAEKLTETMDDTVREMHDSAQQLLETLRRSVDDLGGQLQRHSSEVTAQFAQSAEGFVQSSDRVLRALDHTGAETQRHLSAVVEQMMTEMSTAMGKARAQLDGQVEHSLQIFGDEVNGKLKLFEESTMRQLNSELQTMGNALTAITKRFVDDYQRLVGNMEEVIRRQVA